jgi:aspartyl-tRNA(Asn)/glutamyl-tRNA(Gln) amidotransferase subunit A
VTEPWPPVTELADAVRSGSASAADLVERALEAATADAELGAFVVLDPDGARSAAEAVDAAVARGEDPGPLAGVPIGVKDLEDCAGLPTGHGSLLYQGRPPVAADSIHVARLRAAGAVPIGKTAAPEFGTLSWTRYRARGDGPGPAGHLLGRASEGTAPGSRVASPGGSAPTAWGVARNPWATDRTPGGSSGGSAAAVAGGLVPLATASDGGGSTRSPAGFSGLVGHKASFGRIPDPRPLDSMTAVVGALATTVADAARHLDVAAGPDPRDRTSLPAPGLSYEAVIETLATAGLRARWSPDLGYAAVDPVVAEVAGAAAVALADAAGLELDETPVRLTDPVTTWLEGGSLDMWLSLEDGMWPAVADDLTPFSRWSLEQTVDAPVSSLVAPARRRAVLEREVGELFAEVDVLLTPTTAVPAFVAEGPPPSEIAGRRVHPAMATPFTMVANLCWNPSTSVPAGLSPDGLPIGLMITCGLHRDDLCLRLARIIEHTHPWPRTAP